MTTESLSVTIEGEVLTVEIGTVAVAAVNGGGGTWGSITGTLSTQTDLQAALDLKAPLASPTLTGTPAAPTAAGGTSTTQIATTAFAADAVSTHAGATDPHGDRAFATSADSTHAALTTGVHGLGGASQLNVGTTAGTVAAGDHAHSGVYQPLATVLTNTTASFTSAQETKLALIETAADVTDAGNVGSAIDGATAKTTPVDADTVPLIDSAASNVLKKLSWANIKATIKTYFDTLYQAILVSGTNIKTVNSTSLLGSGDIAISASPGGSTTQLQYNNAGAFAGMSGTAWDNTNRSLVVTGATVTANKPLLDMSQTFNNAAVAFTAVKVNVTNTASAIDSSLLSLQTGGVSRVEVLAAGGTGSAGPVLAISAGKLNCPAISFAISGAADTVFGSTGLYYTSQGFVTFGGASTEHCGLGVLGLGLTSSKSVTWSSGSTVTNGPDLYLSRDTANTLAQRNGTNAQTSRVYGTYTDASNYVRAALAATSTAVTLTAETAGTGADDVPVVLTPAGVAQVEVGNGVQFAEMTAPSAPAANKVILYAVDNGAGKTQLMALFSSGAAQQVAIQP